MIPFEVEIPQAELDDLDRRLAEARLPADDGDRSWDDGLPHERLQELLDYWQSSFRWRTLEAEINSFPQFHATIDGADIHVVHLRSPEPDATPLVLTHGWPGSFLEFLPIARKLADPVAHGGRREDAFHVVIPSIPGHGFSTLPAGSHWDYGRTARAWTELMTRLGYDEFVAHGGDHGSFISMEIARFAPERVLGVHVNMLLTVPSGDPEEMARLGTEDMRRLGRLGHFDAEVSGYMKLQSTRPRAVSFAFVDSPVGQLAWLAEKFAEFSDSAQDVEKSLGLEAVVAHAALYWLTRTAPSSARMFREARGYMQEIFTPGHRPSPLGAPLAVLALQGDFAPVRPLAEAAYPEIVRWTDHPAGGHFASLEAPDVFVDDLRGFARAVTDTRRAA